MAGLSGLIGTAGGFNGTGISGPSGANITNPVTAAQTNQSFDQAQQGLAQQQAFVQALNAQNGLGNQTNVFNQMQGVANGTGPNPAQAMLANTTGANVANQAAMMAGQRGTGANAGLLGRQAAMQGANIQQQAAGQGAALQAQQSLAALGQMGGIANTQAANQAAGIQNYNQAAQGEQANLLNSVAGVNNARVGMQSNINSNNANLAGIVMQGQQNLQGNMMPSAGSVMSMLADGGEVGVPPIQNTQPGPITKIADSFGGKAGASGGKGEDGGGGGGGLMSMMALLAGGGVIVPPIQNTQPGPMTTIQDYFNKPSSTKPKDDSPKEQKTAGMDDIDAKFKAMVAGGGEIAKGPQSKIGQHLHKMASGGKVKALVSPGEKYLSPNDVKKVEQGADPMSTGETIPGKPKVKGAKNSYANDTVPKTLDEGGIVLPRSVTQAKHPHWAAHQFVAAIMAKKGKTLPKKSK